MRLHTGTQACLLLLAHAVERAAGVNFTQCFIGIVANANSTHNLAGLLDADGYPVSNVSDATAISYSLCTSVCGSGPRTFNWLNFSQDFSAWLLPNLALISQLPFGAQYNFDDLMSAVLTVGSPALAGYSLLITVLNSRWINRRFTPSVNYPNSHLAVSILSSLQQVPLRLHFHAHFPSLVILPENDSWWRNFSELVDYTHTWSIASATSIAWVVVAYILTVANSPTDSYVNLQADGDATGTLWLWLISIVVGWLQLSPKCNFDRLRAAYDRADRYARTGTPDTHIGMSPPSAPRALTITATEGDVMSPDELLTPPVFNYTRSLQWASTAETVFLVFKVASEKAQSRIPVRFEAEWIESNNIKHIHPTNRRGSPQEIAMYCAQPDGARRSHWAPGVFTRMAVASCASLALQWGTVGGAVTVAYFTPTTRIGCRSLSYLIYGGISTLVLAMLLMSSILAHYSASCSKRASLAARVTLASSHWLRRMGKLLAIVNAIWVVLVCMFQYSNVYDTCFCKSSVIGRGKAAYAVIIETSAQAALLKVAWTRCLLSWPVPQRRCSLAL
ncbi:uncharacterized protein EDB91DRAFT_876367 [Suillus paluster]|uniref:uncharacterized protein n=1 Tax=Suillus paluster TaxID=48578 RepID=UPI001B8855BB|nr:uncharacterized protein EDB91DRAFT_876367 [Suillus paluster]KAG1748358.1 hypothetical protein EDB91DRAFT_876367 [Suillus paluster]